MDGTGVPIITQVSRDQAQGASGVPVSSNGSIQQNDGAPAQPPPTGRRGFLATLCCCVSSKDNDTDQGDHHQPTSSAGGGHSPAAPQSGGEVPLLPPQLDQDRGKKCVVIDLDETLVHSSFKPVANADFIVPVEIDGVVHQVYVLKRPHVDQFLKRMGELFECVLFTASLSKYADPVTDLLDRTGCFRARLFREHCVFHRGNYVKDLSRLGRDINNTVIIDNSPASYIFHPDNAVPVGSWFDDPTDTELLDLIPFFEGLSRVKDAVEVLRQS